MLSAERVRWACSWLNIVKREKEKSQRAERMEENNPPQHRRHRRAMKNVCFRFDRASDGAGATARCNDKRVNKIIVYGKITVSRLCKFLEIAFDTRWLLIHRTEYIFHKHPKRKFLLSNFTKIILQWKFSLFHSQFHMVFWLISFRFSPDWASKRYFFRFRWKANAISPNGTSSSTKLSGKLLFPSTRWKKIFSCIFLVLCLCWCAHVEILWFCQKWNENRVGAVCVFASLATVFFLCCLQSGKARKSSSCDSSCYEVVYWQREKFWWFRVRK